MYMLPSTLAVSFCTVYTICIASTVAFTVRTSIIQHRPTTKIKSTSSSSSLSFTTNNDITIIPIEEDDTKSLLAASQFMLESFWIPLSYSSPIPPDIYSRLTFLHLILEDLTDQYGEINGQNQLPSRLLSARNNDNTIVGIVGVDVGIVDTARQYQYTRSEAEDAVRMAVSGLSPSKKREWGDRSIKEIVAVLLPEECRAVAILSNLAVDASRRRLGIGSRLCRAVDELVAREDFGGGGLDVYLRVEGGNEAARRMYEGMGFGLAWVEEEAMVLRADLEGNSGFVEKISEVVSYMKGAESKCFL